MKKSEKKFFSKLGKKGGKATLAKHGAKYFKKIARLRWRNAKKGQK